MPKPSPHHNAPLTRASVALELGKLNSLLNVIISHGKGSEHKLAIDLKAQLIEIEYVKDQCLSLIESDSHSEQLHNTGVILDQLLSGPEHFNNKTLSLYEAIKEPSTEAIMPYVNSMITSPGQAKLMLTELELLEKELSN